MSQGRHRVVIVGGGFGGVRAARALARTAVDITMVDRTNHHLFQPLLYQVATGILPDGLIAPALRSVVSNQANARVVLADVQHLDLDGRAVHALAPDGQKLMLSYDSLVVAAGCADAYFGHDEWAVFAPGLHSRACRFGSAGEMAEQLTGVLREVLATADGVPRSAFSTVFSPELQAIGTGDDAAGGPEAALAVPRAAQIIAGMPMPQVDRADPAAGYLATFAGLDSAQRAAALSGAVAGDAAVPAEVASSAETRLALARAQLDVGDYDGAGATLADLAAEDPADWRIAWTDGLRRLAAGETDTDGAGAAAARGAFS